MNRGVTRNPLSSLEREHDGYRGDPYLILEESARCGVFNILSRPRKPNILESISFDEGKNCKWNRSLPNALSNHKIFGRQISEYF